MVIADRVRLGGMVVLVAAAADRADQGRDDDRKAQARVGRGGMDRGHVDQLSAEVMRVTTGAIKWSVASRPNRCQK